ncbi:Methionine ABC transporter permease OS=Lysinibacillus sphaericus OX=1421 GN=LS41612_20530 PE=3 SV=1 [Lysinibacillus sphaericus]
MFDVTHLIDMVPDLLKAFQETIIMIGISLSVSIVLGLPLGILLFVTDKGLFWENRLIKSVFGFAVNLIRSIPYIILLVALFPLTKLLVGQTIGTHCSKCFIIGCSHSVFCTFSGNVVTRN